jgi:hypothetical protein
MWQDFRAVLADSFARVSDAFVAVVPGALAMLVIVGVALVLAALVRLLLERALARMGFDRRAREWGLVSGQDLDPHHRPSHLVARGAFWLVLLAGAAVALDALGAASTSALGRELLGYLPRLVSGLLVFLVGLGAARFLERSALIGCVNLRLENGRFVAAGVKWLVLLFATAMAIERLGVGGGLAAASFAILLAGAALAAALAAGLGARSWISRALEKRDEGQASTPAPRDEERRIQHL